MNLVKKIIYYILLTISFIFLPMAIRNVYLSILVKSHLGDILINIISGLFIFSYPFCMALLLRYNLKYNKWPIDYFFDKIEEDESGE